MNRPLLLLPLDDRPVNLQYPPLLAQLAGDTLLTPPPALLGHFLLPGAPQRLADWLLVQAPAARAALISLDMLAYGGLVASRTPQLGVETALSHLQVLRRLKAHHPTLRISAFSVIMRLTITGSDTETRAAGRDIFRYSVLRDQCDRLGDTHARAELATLESRIPPRLLADYLYARKRNHAVNLAAIDLLADGVLDFLALVQEDTAPCGLHVGEQAALHAYARERVDAAHWLRYPGADEAAMTLLARELLRESAHPFPVSIALRDPQAARYPALFEDMPLAGAVSQHLAAAGGHPDEHGVTVAVHGFLPPQRDLFDEPPLPTPSWETALATFPPLADHDWPAWSPAALAIADVAYCNGGDPHLLASLCADGRYPHLHAYAGWNTAGNTLGATFAHAALRHLAAERGMNEAMMRAHRQALFIRLLDDGLYQPIVRGWAMARVEEFGASPLNVASMAPRAEALVHDALQQLWREVRHGYPALAEIEQSFRARLPWGRLFEVEIELE